MAASFTDMINSPMPEPKQRANVQVDFARPDGDGTFSSEYDMCDPIDVATVNKNIADGYRVTALSIVV